MCAQALTGCPARSGSRFAAVSRRIASCRASWYRWPLVRSSSFPAGADSASSTAATAAAHPAVRSPCSTPGPADRGGQLHLTVGELPARVLIGQVPPGPHVHLREQPGQVRQPQAAGRGRQQLLVRRVPVLVRQFVGPQADHSPDGLRHAPRRQRRQHPRMRRDPLGPRAVPDGGAPGDPGPVDQPGHRAVVPVPGGPLPGGERGQERRPAPPSAAASFCSSSRRHSAWAAAGSWAASAAARYPSPARTMSSASRAFAGAVPTWSPPRRDWSPLRAVLVVPGRGRLLGSEFDSTPRLRHFPRETRRSAKSVRMVEMGFVMS